MKFMIVDDEPIVREGLKTLIDWDELGFTLCGEAADGVEAVTKIMEEKPDLVILDIRIPELSGMEVAAAVRKKGYSGKIIILSGFSDFTYAQNAINHGVEAYLLKPIDQRELLAALLRVREKIEQENILELYNNQKPDSAKNMLFKHLLTGSIKCFPKDFNNYGLSLNVRPFQLIMLDYSPYNDVNINSIYHDWNTIYEDTRSECITIENSIILLLKGLSSIQYFAEHILFYLEKMEKDTYAKPFVIISDTFYETNCFSEYFQKLKNIASRKFFYYEKNKPVFLKDLESQKEKLCSNQLNPIEFIERIYAGLLNKDIPLIDLTLKELYHVLQNRNFTIEQTFQVLINCILELKTLLQGTYIKEFMSFNETELIAGICNGKTLYEILCLLNNRFTYLSKYVKNSSDINIVERILNYIDIHYNEEIKLEKIAELFGYNPAYLGRLLAQQLGLNFNLYIEKKRLDKAIDLLIHTDIKIPDISILIGYQNVEYFYRKFKKYTNLTPGNFRAKHCNIYNKNFT